MATNLKLLLIAGARPNFMKLAPLVKAVEHHNATAGNGSCASLPGSSTPGSITTRKCRRFSLRSWGFPPRPNLEAGSGSHAVQTAEIMKRFEPVCLGEKPDWVVVVGDVNSTMACTLVAAKMGIGGACGGGVAQL